MIGSSMPPSTATTTTPPNLTTEKVWATPPHDPFQNLNFGKEYITRTAWKHGMLGALNLVTAILAVRLTLLVAVCGAVWLTWLALQQPDPYRLGALGVYAGIVVVPMVWLASRR